MEKLGKWSPLQGPQLMTSQGWKLKRWVLLSRWETQGRKVRRGQGQPTWESAGGTSGPLEEKGKLYDGYCWLVSNRYRGLTRNPKKTLPSCFIYKVTNLNAYKGKAGNTTGQMASQGTHERLEEAVL